MIKNDKWIRSKCIQPTRVILAPATKASTGGFSHCQQGENIYLTHDSEEKAEALLQSGIILSHRAVTKADIELYNWKPMIEPFVPDQVRARLHADAVRRSEMAIEEKLKTIAQDFDGDEEYNVKKIVSFGTSSFGYDVRLANKFKIFTNINSGVIDPLDMQDKCYVDFEGDTCIIPPNSYVLGHTVEVFKIPRDVMVLCVGKSTYARCGAIVNVTPIEAGFEGDVVIEISNATNLPMKVHANQGIAQFLFFQSDEACETSYADRGGKYQGQRGVTTAKV